MTSTTLTLEELMAHSGWLRRLAAGLLGDSAAADDAVQEAYISAMRRPPDDRGSVRGWLGAVLTNRVRSDARDERRRRRLTGPAAGGGREVGGARRGPGEVSAGIDLQQSIASLLLELGEPYRQVVYLRFFE